MAIRKRSMRAARAEDSTAEIQTEEVLDELLDMLGANDDSDGLDALMLHFKEGIAAGAEITHERSKK